MITDDKLIDVNERLKSIQSVISTQEDEILKTKETILRLQICLLEQNEALTSFKKQRKIIKEEQRKLSQSSNADIESSGSLEESNDENQENDSYRSCENPKENDSEIKSLKRKNDEVNDECEKNRKVDCGDEVKEDDISIKRLWTPTVYLHLQRVDVPNLKSNTIFAAYSYHNKLYLGGSHGLLIQYSSDCTFNYEVKTDRNIYQIEMFKCHSNSFLVAITSSKILIYNTRKRLCEHVFELPSIRNVVSDSNILYIVLMNGSVKRLYKETWKITNEVANDYMKRKCYLPFPNGNFAFLTLQDCLLYKMKKRDFEHLDPLPGLSKIHHVRMVTENDVICYSDNTLWFLAKDCSIWKTLVFNVGIHFIHHCKHSLVVADKSNVVHVYTMGSERIIEKLFQKDVGEKITAVAIDIYKVFVVTGHRVYSIQYSNDGL